MYCVSAAVIIRVWKSATQSHSSDVQSSQFLAPLLGYIYRLWEKEENKVDNKSVDNIIVNVDNIIVNKSLTNRLLSFLFLPICRDTCRLWGVKSDIMCTSRKVRFYTIITHPIRLTRCNDKNGVINNSVTKQNGNSQKCECELYN